MEKLLEAEKVMDIVEAVIHITSMQEIPSLFREASIQ